MPGMHYYGRTHRHPNSTFRYTTSSLMDLMSWDATDNIDLINTPLLMMAGEKADSLYMATRWLLQPETLTPCRLLRRTFLKQPCPCN